ncbi:hypothetical protein [Sphingobacterium griseoflavum]|uniref:Uncharacterized protein n=1 Tax=Sphingobacterium griseoflavum TaxID=1474952 RepID=A0ABQ3HSZ3_9SPHI|nr:hypothetical protein [Sphingobacterium griseoflavum]GHE30776.1 hypothetical protein GCM10017764_12170 [Sphingobacterium griseoflavum]
MGKTENKRTETHGSFGDLEKTIIINNLMRTPFEQRNQQWRADFLANIAGANLKLGNPEVVMSNDGYPYFQLETVNTGENFQAVVLERQLDTLLEHGFGVVINAQASQPDWVFSYGDLVNLKINKEFYTDKSIFSNPKEQQCIGKDEDILVGQPSEEILPRSVRQYIREFLQESGVKNPKVMLIARNYTDEKSVSQDLVFNMVPAQFSSEKDFDRIMKSLSWFLPKHYSFFGVDEMSVENGFQPV